MEYKSYDIKKGVKLHTINTNKFKTNITAIFLTTKLSKDEVTKNALISSVLRRGSKTMPSQEVITKQLEEMYGAGFDCGVDKTGDNQVIKFYIESINDTFIPQDSNKMWKTAFEKLIEIVFNPLIENGGFNEKYVEQEKNTIKQVIEGRKDNKAKYALDRCIEEMYQNQEFSIYKFGYEKDLEKIDAKSLYEQYINLINNSKIDIFISGEFDKDEDDLEEVVVNNVSIENLPEREPNFKLTTIEKSHKKGEEKQVAESMEVTQGKLVIGLDIDIDNEDLKYDVMVYNFILGGTANSKMFQNVREKAHLAYVAGSSYMRHKNTIFINCGIDIPNYEKALSLIKEQIEDIKKGDFTNTDVEEAKENLISSIQLIDDEQFAQITYKFGQELSGDKKTIEEYIGRVQKITKEDILNIANSVNINTIYFLKD